MKNLIILLVVSFSLMFTSCEDGYGTVTITSNLYSYEVTSSTNESFGVGFNNETFSTCSGVYTGSFKYEFMTSEKGYLTISANNASLNPNSVVTVKLLKHNKVVKTATAKGLFSIATCQLEI